MRRHHLWTILALASIQSTSAPSAEPIPEKPISPVDRQHWSFQPPARPIVPTVKQASWIRTPVDSFILAKLEATGLSPSTPAEKLVLLRRLYLDLVGLPPTPEEQDAFLADSSPSAYEKVVDRLLTSPQYGERWAQHWLDVVRFGESNGYEMDADRPHAWRYRDYVARSFNADKPYDQFLTEQLAGDELAAGKDAREVADLWIASGMHRCGPIHLVSGNVDPAMVRQELLIEYVQGVGAAVLGLTFNCARCHDHKFDPVSQADYYRLEAFFAAAKFKDVEFATPEEKQTYKDRVAALNAKINPLKTQVEAIDKPYRAKIRDGKRDKLEPAYRAALDTESSKRTAEQKQLASQAETLIKVTWDEIIAALAPEDRARRTDLREQQHALEAQLPPPPPSAWTIADEGAPPPTHVLKRGELGRKIGTVEPAFPRVLAVSREAQPSASRLNRRDLAKWIAQQDHPLTARVIMNRVWQHHFGRGLVGTPNDFGLRGDKPTHPELLDFLATEFTANGWHFKPMHKMIVMSNTYQQSSRSRADDDRLIGRMNRQRLDGESLRDCMLAAAGTLTTQVGGPSIRVPLEPEVYDLIFTEGEPDGLWSTTPDATQHNRRSLYLLAKRNVRLPMLEAFDQPDRLFPCANRGASTFAPQALILMNGPFTQQQSRAMASRLLHECSSDLGKQIERAYQRAFSRRPTTEEVTIARQFLKDQSESAADRLRARLPAGVPDELPARADMAHAVALADFCLALFNANEFAYAP
ncbi:MAG TPA: DUF1549 and DUF1553 domain-containing protein [Gemmataceae bacterium]|jgi:hypothetical protein|nr:DUF1549 and DUF1553 domain-containing protein [Gemmataceae bacterium]